MTNNIETIVLGGGCFWCTEAVMKEMAGVKNVVPGYAGGHTKNPNYSLVSTGMTGHVEVIKVDYDPSEVNLQQILEVFFKTHDPTSLNKQGADTGTQYRSIVLFSNHKQKLFIDDFIKQQQTNYTEPIVTEIKPLETFYEAEEYHHDYFAKNPSQAYCQVVIAPKVEKAREILNK